MRVAGLPCRASALLGWLRALFFPPAPAPESDPGAFGADVGGVMIGTPCYGGLVTAGYLTSALATRTTLLERGINNCWVTISGESLIQRARNEIAARFLAWEKATHLVFVDADIAWEAEDLVRLLAHDEPVVCGLYPKKTYPLDYAFHPRLDELGQSRTHPRSGAVEIENAATGFLCIKREAFEALKAVCPKIERAGQTAPEHLPHLYNFFPVEVEDGILWSEDYGFCRRWRSLGGKVWADTTIKLTHTGAHAFEGDPSLLCRPAEAAVAGSA